MTGPRRNVHATAIVVGTTGVLLVGELGSGKSGRAFACLQEAAARGLFAALVADDQVFVSQRGGVILAEAPQATAGRIELRGTGIVEMPSLSRAVLHVAVRCVRAGEAPRLPAEGEEHELFEVGRLPLVRLPKDAPALATLAAGFPDLLRI